MSGVKSPALVQTVRMCGMPQTHQDSPDRDHERLLRAVSKADAGPDPDGGGAAGRTTYDPAKTRMKPPTPILPCPIHWDGDFIVWKKSEVICPKCGTRYRVERHLGWSSYHAVNEKPSKEAE